MAPVTFCSVEGCPNTAKARGWCARHYAARFQFGNPTRDGSAPRSQKRPAGSPVRVCSISGCGDKAWARDLCLTHYHRLMRYGDPLGGLPALTHEQVQFIRANRAIPTELMADLVGAAPSTIIAIRAGRGFGRRRRLAEPLGKKASTP